MQQSQLLIPAVSLWLGGSFFDSPLYFNITFTVIFSLEFQSEDYEKYQYKDNDLF